MDWTGSDFSAEDFDKIMTIDREEWKKELVGHQELFERMYDKLPQEFASMRQLLLSGLWRSAEQWHMEPDEA
jgi:phosphoenolpyruvate carboxykinase (GTP)